jgi:hypothetical protein
MVIQLEVSTSIIPKPSTVHDLELFTSQVTIHIPKILAFINIPFASRLSSTEYRGAVGPTQPPIQNVLAILSPAMKRLWCEADHSRPTNAKVMNG